MKCTQCGREVTGNDVSFCPYCGARLERPEKTEMARDPRAEEWVRKALAVSSLPDRKKILEKAKADCPNAPEIDWEMLFIGRKDPKPPRGKMDYSIIKSWLLQIYREPGELSAEKQERMRTELFEDPELLSVLERYPDPGEKMREYLTRLCREYIEIFLDGDSRLTGTIFGFRISRNKDRIIGSAAAQMLRRIDADNKVKPEHRMMLRQAMVQAFSDFSGGKTEYLEAGE